MIQEQAKLIEEKEKEGSSDALHAHAEMEKRLEEREAMSTRAVKKLSEKRKIIQEEVNLIKEKEKSSSTDGPSAKDKEILSA